MLGAMNARELRPLTALEARVVAVLVEKEKTVPDVYPMSLNALVAGCNQKTSRDPVIQASENEVLVAIDALKGLSLVIESSGGRVMRYAQNLKRVIEVPNESVALLATLMLRGPQTVAELRANADRLCRFSDLSAVEAFLDELANRSAGPLVVELRRQPGARENRWMHRLCGDVAEAAEPGAPGHAEVHRRAEDLAGPGDSGDLGARVAALEHEVDRLQATLARLCRSLGVDEERA